MPIAGSGTILVGSGGSGTPDPGELITKENIVESFKTMRDTYNTGIVWHSGDSPFTPTQTNTYNDVLNDRDDPASGSDQGFALGDIEDNILDAKVTASTIVTQFKNYASALSRIRKARLIKYYSTTFPPDGRAESQVNYDETEIASLHDKYATSMDDVDNDISTGELVTVSALETFVSNLSDAIAAVRDAEITFKEYYCHSSCHSSCHGSI